MDIPTRLVIMITALVRLCRAFIAVPRGILSASPLEGAHLLGGNRCSYCHEASKLYSGGAFHRRPDDGKMGVSMGIKMMDVGANGKLSPPKFVRGVPDFETLIASYRVRPRRWEETFADINSQCILVFGEGEDEEGDEEYGHRDQRLHDSKGEDIWQRDEEIV